MGLNYDKDKPTRLEQWVPVDMGDGKMMLGGDVYNHPRGTVPDGQDVLTTELVAYNPELKIARTKTGTRYHLGELYFTGREDFWKILANCKLPREA